MKMLNGTEINNKIDGVRPSFIVPKIYIDIIFFIIYLYISSNKSAMTRPSGQKKNRKPLRLINIFYFLFPFVGVNR